MGITPGKKKDPLFFIFNGEKRTVMDHRWTLKKYNVNPSEFHRESTVYRFNASSVTSPRSSMVRHVTLDRKRTPSNAVFR